MEFLFSSERHYNSFPALTPSSDVTELKLKTLCFCLRLLIVKIWAGNSKFVFAFLKIIWGSPCHISITRGSYCYSGTIVGFFSETRRCFLLCLHVSNNSLLLFNMVFWSSVNITSFSVRQRSQDLPPLENACPRAFIDHFISKGVPLSFKFQMYDESVVWLSGFFFMECLCWLYLFLNESSVDP